jgi:hypothetical protein
MSSFNANSPRSQSLYLFAPSLALIAFLALSSACAPRYEYRAIPVRAIDSYPGHANIAGGGKAGAVAFYDKDQLTALFGFDLKKAGVVPVQLAIENDSAQPILLMDGALLEDEAGQRWEILPSSVVYARIDDYTSGGLSGKEGVRRTLLWGLAGAVVGAAVGVASGTSVAEGAGKGGAIGGALGAASSIAGLGTQEDTEASVVRDFSNRSMAHNTVAPGETASGFLYFPGETLKPARLHLRLKPADREAQTIILALR